MIKVVAALGLLMASAAQAVEVFHADPVYDRGEKQDFIWYTYKTTPPAGLKLAKVAVSIIAQEAQKVCRDKPIGPLERPVTIVVRDPTDSVLHMVDRCW